MKYSSHFCPFPSPESLCIPATGNNALALFSKTGHRLTTGYVRVLVFARTLTIECTDAQIELDGLRVPPGETARNRSRTATTLSLETIEGASLTVILAKSLAGAPLQPGHFYLPAAQLWTVDGEPVLRTGTTPKLQQASLFA